ncbi:spermidine synthase [Saccharopolyspora griseoalba]|uniref:Spermidine synthase n=1 Tax=Saccharopolyspora griseoalba TaxID=1431848 RepID=A0ABW2LQ43_9PSEU
MPEVIARAASERGELVLQRRDGALELRVNGVFVMDTEHTETERLLAAETLRAVERDRLRVLIGGLGLGFTLREVLADERVAEAHVVEIEPDLIDWHRRGLVPDTAEALQDPRTRVSAGDVAEVLGEQEPCDVLLLDVDNGPDFLVYEDNSALYEAAFLRRCAGALAPGGTLAVWSADTSEPLLAAMREVFGECAELAIPVSLGRRETTYHLFVSRKQVEFEQAGFEDSFEHQ